METKSALDYSRMPTKPQDIFTTVIAIVCHKRETRCFVKCFHHCSTLCPPPPHQKKKKKPLKNTLKKLYTSKIKNK